MRDYVEQAERFAYLHDREAEPDELTEWIIDQKAAAADAARDRQKEARWTDTTKEKSA